VFHALDIGSPESVREFAKWIKSTYGGLDILVIIFNFLFPNERTVDKDLRLVQI
jgi:NAD(P)-dependent dehydrogenase (short-subunit alcohol dehydrogenase family)